MALAREPSGSTLTTRRQWSSGLSLFGLFLFCLTIATRAQTPMCAVRDSFECRASVTLDCCDCRPDIRELVIVAYFGVLLGFWCDIWIVYVRLKSFRRFVYNPPGRMTEASVNKQALDWISSDSWRIFPKKRCSEGCTKCVVITPISVVYTCVRTLAT